MPVSNSLATSHSTVISRRAHQPVTAPTEHNLPLHLTPFVGRQAEQQTLQRLFDQARLITVVGPGGAGKTRLAIHVAHQMYKRFQHGVSFVSLETTTTPDALVFALAEKLRLPTYRGVDPQRQLLDALRYKQLLLLLDNFEQLIAHATLLIDILQHAPQVQILVTSRERLNLQVEFILEVNGLEMPTQESWRAVKSSQAAQLFLGAAQRVCPGFAITADNWKAILHLCRCVDGLPLALELAGAWVRLLSCEEIVQHIEQDLDFLTVSWADIPLRQRSLKTVLKTSWDLLTQRQRQVLGQLTIFADGFTRVAAYQVVGASLSILSTLVDRSLIQWHADLARYHLHPLLKRFIEQQGQPGDEIQAAACRAHRLYFLELVQHQTAALYGHHPDRAAAVIGAEIKDIVVAWQGALAADDLAALAASLDGLSRFYELQSRYHEGQTLFAQAIEQLSQHVPFSAEDELMVNRLRIQHGKFLCLLGDLTQAEVLLQQVLAVFRTGVDHGDIIHCLIWLGRITNYQGRNESACTLLAEAAERAQQIHHLFYEARSRLYWGITLRDLGQFTAAEQQDTQALALYRTLGDRQGEGAALRVLGDAFFEQRNYERAAPFIHQALSIDRELHDLSGESLSLGLLAGIYYYQARYAEANTYVEQVLLLMRQVGDRHMEGICLSNLGCNWQSLGAFVEADACFAQALVLFRELGARRLEGNALACLGLQRGWQGDYVQARDYSQQALDIALALEDQSGQGMAATDLGHALAALGQLAEAEQLYRQAYTVRQQIGQIPPAIESLAGLGAIAVQRGDLAQAAPVADELLAYLTQQPLYGVDDALGVYWTLYQLLQMLGDSRAAEWFERAYRLLQEYASRISPDSLRRSFLENLPAHRKIMRERALRPVEDLPPDLTRQEFAVLRLLAAGLTNHQIAAQLQVTLGTVKTHAHHILQKLQVQNRTQAVARARELHLL
ncbi:Putative HTH-type transcriptional regulator [Thermoflexales bacterium]|nr:Putative HTH-type transcriptional regulator [Thermoflexales bacterium]